MDRNPALLNSVPSNALGANTWCQNSQDLQNARPAATTTTSQRSSRQDIIPKLC